jgi:dihydrofolate reductase
MADQNEETFWRSQVDMEFFEVCLLWATHILLGPKTYEHVKRSAHAKKFYIIHSRTELLKTLEAANEAPHHNILIAGGNSLYIACYEEQLCDAWIVTREKNLELKEGLNFLGSANFKPPLPSQNVIYEDNYTYLTCYKPMEEFSSSVGS